MPSETCKHDSERDEYLLQIARLRLELFPHKYIHLWGNNASLSTQTSLCVCCLDDWTSPEWVSNSIGWFMHPCHQHQYREKVAGPGRGPSKRLRQNTQASSSCHNVQCMIKSKNEKNCLPINWIRLFDHHWQVSCCYRIRYDRCALETRIEARLKPSNYDSMCLWIALVLCAWNAFFKS